jgi:hypothetical protein
MRGISVVPRSAPCSITCSGTPLEIDSHPDANAPAPGIVTTSDAVAPFCTVTVRLIGSPLPARTMTA